MSITLTHSWSAEYRQDALKLVNFRLASTPLKFEDTENGLTILSMELFVEQYENSSPWMMKSKPNITRKNSLCNSI
jgi:hypothetical protein